MSQAGLMSQDYVPSLEPALAPKPKVLEPLLYARYAARLTEGGAPRSSGPEAVATPDERLDLQLRIMLPPEDAFFADGHILQCPGCGQDGLLKTVNLAHGIGLVIWLFAMTSTQIYYIKLLWADDLLMALFSVAFLVLGWLCFLFFQIYTPMVVNSVLPTEEWSEKFIRQFLAKSDSQEYRGVRNAFRATVATELCAIMFILASTLLTSYAHVQHYVYRCTLQYSDGV